MPATLTYPGVYIEELPSGVHTITGVATSITAFVGQAKRGPVDEATRVQSFAEFERTFGGLWVDSTLGYAVSQFFQNGGGDTLIVRVYHKPSAAQVAAGAALDGIAVTTLQSGGVAAQGTLTVANNPNDGETMTIGGQVYTFRSTAGTAAQGTLTLDTPPSDGETMTIGGQVYTFQTALTNSAGNILIGATLADTQANIVAAINADPAGAGTKYAAATVQNPAVAAASAFAANKLVLTANTAGAAGNSVATTSTFAAPTNVFDAATLGATTPGADPGLANVSGNIAIGASTADTQVNIVAAIIADPAGAGTQYAAATVQNPAVAAASAFAANKLVLTAKTAGAAGNSIATTSTLSAGNAFDAATLGTTTLGVDSGPSGPGSVLAAAGPGAWANNLRVRIDHQTRDPSDTKTFNLEIREIDPGLPTTAPAIRSEKFLNLSVDQSSALFVDNVLKNRSTLARVLTTSSNRPDAITDGAFAGGSDGLPIDNNDLQGSPGGKTGIYALEDADLFNLLCIPPLLVSGAVSDLTKGTRDAASQYCAKRRALFVADPSTAWATPAQVISGLGGHMDPTANAALYFPMISAADPLRENQIEDFAPCGAVAGVMARTDATRGVWKAPAGIEATVAGASALTVKLTDGENGQLNPIGVNCLRSFPIIGRVVWGARTMRGADQLADQWKYIPVRRLALYIEESLFRGTQWVVFEPNDEPLWAQIRLNIGAFMNTLFRQGAFQGGTPKEAYFVKCNSETTTQTDIDNGIVNIIVGFAPLKPAEFVVIQIQQIAGQIQT
jgi:phage tail sheath protein FI